MTIDDTIKEITEIINWYRSLPADYTGINDLMFQRIQLVTLMSYYATSMSEYRKQWKESEIALERKKRTIIVERLDVGEPMSKSQEYGKFLSLDEYATERRYDGAYNEMRSFYDVCNKIVDALNQHISNLKREEDQTKII